MYRLCIGAPSNRPDRKQTGTPPPSSTVRATLSVDMSTGWLIGPRSEPAISCWYAGSHSSVPSASVNSDRWDLSHRANAVLIASAKSSKVCDGPTANTRPGYGQNPLPPPPRSSTVIENQVRAITSSMSHHPAEVNTDNSKTCGAYYKACAILDA